MKTILTLFFLAALTTAATAGAPLTEEPFKVEAYYNGELCGVVDDKNAIFQGFDSTVPEGQGNMGGIYFEIYGKIARQGMEARTLTCETTLELTFPKGYRFYVVAPKVYGYMKAGADFVLDIDLDIRAGMGQYQRFQRTVVGSPDGGDLFDLFFDEGFRREVRSDCSGTAELVVTNTSTLSLSDHRIPGGVDDIGMAFIDTSHLSLEWERCAPGEL